MQQQPRRIRSVSTARFALVVALVATHLACGQDGPDARGQDAGADLGPQDVGDASDAGTDAVDLGVDPDVDASPDAPDGPDADPPRERVVGPGLGNLAYDEDELFVPLSWVDATTGVPPSLSAFRLAKPFGTNMAYMFNGWFVTLFASDSGHPGGGLLVYDVSDPRSPVLVHREFELFSDGRTEQLLDPMEVATYDGRTGSFREAHAIGFSRVGASDLAMFHTARGVEIWDLSDVRAPLPVGALDLPGVDAGDYRDVSWQVAWQGRYAYVAGSDQGVFVVDALDPAAPVLAERDGPNPIPPGELGGFRVGPIFAWGNHLVISSMDTEGGYAVLDISDPVEPTLLSSLTTGLTRFYSMCVSGPHMYGSVRGSGARLTAYDIADPFAIVEIDASLVIDEQLYCGTQDEFVFSGNERDFTKVDVSDPDAFVIVGSGSLGRPGTDHGQMSLFGNLVFVGNDHGTGSAFVPHQAGPDTRPPIVTAVSPEDGAVHQAASSRIGLAFSDAIDNLSVDDTTLRVVDAAGAPVPGRWAFQAHILNFSPDEPLAAGARYRVEVPAGGVRDWAGNAIAEAFASEFEVSPLAPDSEGRLSVTIAPLEPVRTGTAVVFSAVASGPGPVEYSWRLGDDVAWTPFSSESSATRTFEAPGHVNVVVQATNGGQRAVASARVTVHRPIVGRSRASSAIALDEARGVAWVANRDGSTVSRVDLGSNALVDEIALGGDPVSVAVDEDGAGWVALADTDELVRVGTSGSVERIALGHGAAPCGVVAMGGAVLVSESGPGVVSRWDSATRRFVDDVAVAGGICGLASSPDGGSLWVSRLRAVAGAGEVFRVHVPASTASGAMELGERVELGTDTSTVDAEDRARGVPGYLGAPALSPDDARAWIPAVQSNTERGVFRDGLELSHETTVRAVLPAIDVGASAELSGRRIDFNDRAGPMAAVVSPLGDHVYVALMGSDEVAIVDAYSGATVGAFGTGAAPRSLALSASGDRLYVHEWLDRTLAVFDTSGVAAGRARPVRVASVRLVASEPLAPEVLRGKRIFNLARDPRMSRDGYLSCASCHLDGAHDGLTWDFTGRGEGLRNTTDLRGRAGLGHGPVHWTANFDEIQDFENDIRGAFGGAGFMADDVFSAGTRSDPLGDPKAGLSADLDALAAYVASLTTFPSSPWRNPDGSASEQAQLGAAVFEALECGQCHSGAALTDSGAVPAPDGLHDVGTLSDASGSRRGEALTGLDTPTLVGLWDGAPYLHDGSASDLRAVLVDRNLRGEHGATAELAPDELLRLIRYLLELE